MFSQAAKLVGCTAAGAALALAGMDCLDVSYHSGIVDFGENQAPNWWPSLFQRAYCRTVNMPALVDTAEIMKFGYPGMDNVKYRVGHVLSYDRRNKNAAWVFEHLNAAKIFSKEASREKSEFKEDDSEPELFRARLTDFRGSGFDRGHLAAAANHKYSQTAMEDTFYLTNMSPQVGKGFNRDKWAELENYARNQVKNNANVWVCTGPLYMSKKEADGKSYIRFETIGKGEVSVPTHFYKVIAAEKTAGAGVSTIEAYLLPNEMIPDNVPLHVFRVPLDLIERKSGLLLFDKVPKKYSLVVV